MDAKITRVEVLLDKLNMVFADAKNDGQLDALELDLLRKYTRQLAEVLELPTQQPTIIPPVAPPVNVEKIEKKEEPPVAKQEVVIPEVIAPIVKSSLVGPEEEIEAPVVIAQKVDAPVIEKPVIEKPVLNETPVVEPIIEAPKVEEKLPEPEVKPIVEQPVAEKIVPPVEHIEKKAEPVVKKPLVKNIDSDDDEDEQTAGLSGKLQAGNKKTLADKISAHKAKDLKSIIPLNDKLSLTKNLFNGDKDAYDNAIKALNAMPSIEAAQQFMQGDLKQKFKWTDNDAVAQLLELLQQKFS